MVVVEEEVEGGGCEDSWVAGGCEPAGEGGVGCGVSRGSSLWPFVGGLGSSVVPSRLPEDGLGAKKPLRLFWPFGVVLPLDFDRFALDSPLVSGCCDLFPSVFEFTFCGLALDGDVLLDDCEAGFDVIV